MSEIHRAKPSINAEASEKPRKLFGRRKRYKAALKRIEELTAEIHSLNLKVDATSRETIEAYESAFAKARDLGPALIIVRRGDLRKTQDAATIIGLNALICTPTQARAMNIRKEIDDMASGA